MRRSVTGWRCQRGAALFVCLLMLMVVLLLGTSSAQNALQEEKGVRSEQDRQIAFQAAEAALADAEQDILNSPDASHSRSAHFSSRGASGMPGDDEPMCREGLCRQPVGTEAPAWQAVDLADAGPASAASIAYGTFTGRHLPTGKGALPSRLPRYIIEPLPYRRGGESADADGMRFFYRITAIGFGARETTQVVLQTFYRKEE